MELGKLGVWVGMDGMSAAAAAAFAKRVEDRGYGALWIPEGRGRNALVLSSWLLCHTKRLIVATGIANIYARDPVAMAGGSGRSPSNRTAAFSLASVCRTGRRSKACAATHTVNPSRRCAPICRQCAKHPTAPHSPLKGR